MLFMEIIYVCSENHKCALWQTYKELRLQKNVVYIVTTEFLTVKGVVFTSSGFLNLNINSF